MDALPNFGFRDLFTHVIGDIARALGERHGETERQKLTREHVASLLVMTLMPRDGVEAILAGHVVMFHGMIVDVVHDSLLRVVSGPVHITRRDAVALNKAFVLNYDRLTEAQKRLAEGSRDAQTGEAAPAEAWTAAPGPARTPPEEPPQAEVSQAETSHAETSDADTAPTGTSEADPSESAQAQSETPVVEPRAVTRSEVLECKANVEAMEALAAADPARFARALGIKEPKPEYLAAAKAQMDGFKIQSAGAEDTGTAATTDGGARPAASAQSSAAVRASAPVHRSGQARPPDGRASDG